MSQIRRNRTARKQKVLFLSRHYTGAYRDNLSVKFEGQLSGLRESGRMVDHFEISENGIFLISNGNTAKDSCIRVSDAKHPSGPLRKLQHYDQLFRAARRQVARGDYDIVYVRSSPPTAAYLLLLKAARWHGAQVVVEIPTYPSVGEISGNTWLRRQALRASEFGKRLEAKWVDLYAVIGENVNGTLRGRPARNIDNGVNVPAIAERTPASKMPELRTEVNVIALASMCKWHGYDRVIRGMAEIRKSERPRIHLVGPDGDGSLHRWKILAEELDVAESVFFHGRLDGEKLRELIDHCHGAIGSLALHRIRVTSASTLKVREYMARGIPFIYATEDPTLTAGAIGALQVSADENPISIGEIVNFFAEKALDQDLPEKMRQYAVQNLSWASTFDGLLDRSR